MAGNQKTCLDFTNVLKSVLKQHNYHPKSVLHLHNYQKKVYVIKVDYPVICYSIRLRRVHRMQLYPYRREQVICLLLGFWQKLDQTYQYCSGSPRNRTLRGISIALKEKNIVTKLRNASQKPAGYLSHIFIETPCIRKI